jgi:hypothetical protein
MSHFLSRLADRTLGLSPSIEPVRLPVFGAEPAADGNVSERESKGFVYGDMVSGAQAAQPAARKSVDRQTDNAVDRKGGVEKRSAVNSPVQPTASRVLHEPSVVDQDHSFSTRAGSQQQSFEDGETSLFDGERSGPTDTFAADPEPSASVLSPISSHVSRSIDGDSALSESGRQARASDTEQPAISHSKGPAVAESMLRPGEFAEPSFSIRDVIDQLPRETNGPQTQAPTIKVNIGRIDVRAVTTPSAPATRQRKKAQSSLSLDDYLRQRSGGQR